MSPLLPVVLVPFTTALLCLAAFRSPRTQRWISVGGTVLHLAAAVLLLQTVRTDGIVATHLGDWPWPFGITFAADLFGALMATLGALVGLVSAVFGLAIIDEARERHGYHALLQLLLFGVSGAFLTGDLFNLYVWFEVLLMSSFVLLALGGERAQLEGAVKYVTLNLLSSALFLAAVGILYGKTGALNMAHLAQLLAEPTAPRLASTLAVLFLCAFGIKAALFPFFFWLPASYHTPPVAVTALFAGLLTKVGVYALFRVFTLLFVHDTAFTHTLLAAIAAATMVVGVLGAAAQGDVRRILSFHIVSQIGYMVLGLALATPLAVAGGIFYLAHNIVAKTNLFLVGGVAWRLGGSFELKRLGGLYRARPFLAALFLVAALGMAGVPPLSGFWAKYFVVRAALEASAPLLAACALAVGLMTLYSMVKIWGEGFWKEGYRPGLPALAPESSTPDGKPPYPTDSPAYASLAVGERLALYAPIVLLAALTIAMGVWIEPFHRLCADAAAQLLDPRGYIDAVMQAGRR